MDCVDDHTFELDDHTTDDKLNEAYNLTEILTNDPQRKYLTR
jgi:hypothetical protein